jgi:LacI family transcriptional regulator
VAFSASLKECGITPNPKWIVEGDHTMEGGMTAMKRLLSTKKMPTAIMCSNDMTAIGVLHKLYRAGLRVPDDFSIIGFDNIHIAEVTIPPLTTVEMSRLDLARAAVTALRERVELVDDSPKKSEFSIRTNLVVRESTGFPRGTMTRLEGNSVAKGGNTGRGHTQPE